jgi:hypothetical protein
LEIPSAEVFRNAANVPKQENSDGPSNPERAEPTAGSSHGGCLVGRLSWGRVVGPATALAASLLVAVVPLARVPLAAAAADSVVFTAAGDIDGCAAGKDTAKIVAKTTGPVATIGDNAYPEGSAEDYAKCYAPSWGAFKARTHPTAGNHDYDVSRATPYYQYFGAAAGEPGQGWYSYDLGSWHVVALNSNCDNVDCGKQSGWLESDLAAHPSACILAYWHHPRFSSGTSGGDSAVGAFWKVLYNHGASIVLNGHDHDYERFAPQDPSGHRDPERGLREFIVGTGGGSVGSFAGTAANSEVRNNRTYGVLELTLRPGGYDWRFVPTAESGNFTDSGSDVCRGTAPAAEAPPTTAAVAPLVEPETPAPDPAGPPDSPTIAPQPAPDTPAPSDPPVGHGRPKGGPVTMAPTPRSGMAAGKAPSAARQPAPTTSVPSTAIEFAPPVFNPPTADPVSPVTDEGSVGASAALGILSGSPARSGGSELTGAPADSASLALALSGLTHPAPVRRPDRRGVAFMAIALLAADGALITALRRRNAVLPASGPADRLDLPYRAGRDVEPPGQMQRVEQAPVVGHDQERAVEIVEGLKVEVVGRLVEDEEVRPAGHEDGQRGARALPRR